MTRPSSVIQTPKYKGLNGILGSLATVQNQLAHSKRLLDDAKNSEGSFANDDIVRYYNRLGIEQLGQIHNRLSRFAAMVQPQDKPTPGYQAPKLPEVDETMPLDQLMIRFRVLVDLAEQWPSLDPTQHRPKTLTMTTYNRLVYLATTVERDIIAEQAPYPFQSIDSAAKVYETMLFFKDLKVWFLSLDEVATTLQTEQDPHQETNPCAEAVTEADVAILATFTDHLQNQWFELMDEWERPSPPLAVE